MTDELGVSAAEYHYERCVVEAIGRVSRKLRDMADEIDRLATEEAAADGRRAERVVHALAWGLANAGADDVVSAERQLTEERGRRT